MTAEFAPKDLLEALARAESPILTSEIFQDVPDIKIKSALDTLKSRDMVQYEPVEREEYHLTAEAEGIAQNGSHEAKVFEAVRQAVEGLKINELPVHRSTKAPCSSLG